MAIHEQGVDLLPNGDRVMPDPALVGRNLSRTSTDFTTALADPNDTVFLDVPDLAVSGLA